jgi:thiol-disulfide isomerase/thioredoxin
MPYKVVVFRLFLLVAVLCMAWFAGFRGLYSHLSGAKNSIKTKNKPPVNLLDNAYLRYKLKKPFAVVFFLSKDCPLCVAYKPLIQKLHSQYDSGGVFSFVVLRTDADTGKDSSFFIPGEFSAGKAAPEIASYYGATVTPEAFVVDSNNAIVYRGAIDNYAWDTGKHRKQATEHYLMDVLAALQQGKKTPFAETKAQGCYIE